MKKSLAVFFSMVAFSAAISVSSISEAEENSKAVMIIADYLDIEDISKMEYLNKLTGMSHVALMNNRQPGKAGASKSKLIIGSGKKLELNTDLVSVEKAESKKEPLSGSLVYMDTYIVKRTNSDSEYQKYIGYIGNEINKNRGITCYIGNADTQKKNRSSMLIAADSSGRIDLGETENINIEDGNFPGGIRTDYSRLAELYKQYLPASSFLVIETGEMERLEGFKGIIPEESFESYRQKVLNDVDAFVKEVVSHKGYKTLIFISTYPSESNDKTGNRMTPIVVHGGKGKGLLYSSNTRRHGIILNTDIADYVLYKLGYLSKCSVHESDKEDPLSELKDMNESILRTSRLRAPALTYYAVLVIAVLGILFTMAAFFGKKTGKLSLSFGINIAHTMLSFPVIFLFIPASYLGWGPIEYVAFSAAASFLLAVVLNRVLKDKMKVILSICLMLQIGLVIDMVTGGILIKQSVLGYDPIIGARFYGIGNEYAGMFMGCSIMVFGCIHEIVGKKYNKVTAAVYFLICTALLGLTFLGANFGGALAGAFGYLLAYYLVFDIKFSKRNVFTGIMILSLTAAALIISDSLGLVSQSHMGGLVRETRANGFGVVISTINRKISMNLRLMRYTIWTKVLLCIIGAISIMFYKPVKQLFYIFNRYKYLKYSWMSIAASSIAGFAVNDSGIVTAAAAMIFAVFTMLIMCIGERKEY